MTTTDAPTLILAIDTASDTAGVALFDGDLLLAELTWYSRQSHSRDLLPALDWLLSHSKRRKEQISGIAVCLGPGSYAGMRVGISTAKALAFGLGANLIGVNRLEADALPVAAMTAGRTVAVHTAGRAEVAWAAYSTSNDGLVELHPPALTPIQGLPALLQPDDLVTAEVDQLSEPLRASIVDTGCRLVPAASARVIAVGRIGIARLAAGVRDDAASLAPLYLRAPAIGPQPPRD